MFSYTDDAIVTSSPTGRHLSTVIRRPCVLMSGWDEHAEAICKVLNELDRKAKAGSLSLHLQTCGRVKRQQPSDLPPEWPTETLKVSFGPRCEAIEPRKPSILEQVNAQVELGARDTLSTGWPKMRYAPDAEQRIAVLERRITDYQIAADKPIEMSGEILRQLYGVEFGSSINHNGRTFKRVE